MNEEMKKTQKKTDLSSLLYTTQSQRIDEPLK